MNSILQKIKAWIVNAAGAVARVFRPVGRLFAKLWSHRQAIQKEFRHKQRLVIMDTDTYKEKWSMQLSFVNIFVWGGVSIIVLVALTVVLIAFTPLRELIPGYTDSDMVEQTYQNALVIDSLEHQLAVQEAMLANIKDVIMGVDPGTHISEVDSLRAIADTTRQDKVVAGAYLHSAADSLLRQEVEQQDHYSVRRQRADRQPATTVSQDRASAEPSLGGTTVLLFTPCKGKIVAPYDATKKHYGVDIAGKTNDAIKAVAPGTVIFANFTTETGYVIAIQHAGGIISIYKHNSSLLKREGDVVRAGEPVGFLGNTGELTSGPHLHFELWVGGNPVNPLHYISF